MSNQIILWDSPNGYNLPLNVSDVVELTSYINVLSTKEIAKINTAYTAQLYDMSVEYTWSRTINILRKKVLSFGSEFVLEMLGRSEESIDQDDFLSEVDVINLSSDLGLINKTAKMSFLQTSEIIRHYIDRDTEEELDKTIADSCIKSCVRYVLAMTDDKHAISFTNFRDVLKLDIVNEQDAVYNTLLTSPYFYKRTTVRTLLNLSKTQKGAELETIYANMNTIIPKLWNDLVSDDRYSIGTAYSEATSEGNKSLVKALKSVLLKTKGFDYVPESLRSNTFIDAALTLYNAHYGMDNFYREPSAAKNLDDLGTLIPPPALSKCFTAVLVCKLGNAYGISNSAQSYLDSILDNMTPERWEFYITQVLPADEDVIYKISAGTERTKRWFNIVDKYSLSQISTTNQLVQRLLHASERRNITRTVDAAEAIYVKIRGN